MDTALVRYIVSNLGKEYRAEGVGWANAMVKGAGLK
jgi:hypothetical protein